MNIRRLLLAHRLPLVGVLAVLCCAPSAPAAAQEGNIFENLFKPPGSTQSADRERAEQSELVLRVERIENALRQLTGQVEELQFRNQQLEAQLRRLEGGDPRAPAEPAPATGGMPRPIVPAPAATGGKRSDAFDPGLNPAAPGAPQPLGSPASASASLARPTGGPYGGTQVASLPGAGATPRELYDAGQAQLQRQDYAGAEQTFRQIIQANKGDRLVPDATFMLGETLFLRQSYNDAAASFLEVSTKYPNSSKAPDALLRLGQSLAALGEKETACATFLEVDRKYPRSPSALRQAVEREQKRVGC